MSRVHAYLVVLREPIKAGEPEADRFEGALRCLSNVATIERLDNERPSADNLAAAGIELRVRNEVAGKLLHMAAAVGASPLFERRPQ